MSGLSKLFEKPPKPKRHFLLHHPRVMQLVGPLVKISCIRFESRHQEGKKAARAAISRKNVCKTIAIRHQLTQNFRFITKCHINSTLFTSKERTEDIYNLEFASLFSHLLPESTTCNIQLVKWITHLGEYIAQGTIFSYFSE